MKTHLDCIPCFVRQTLEAAKCAAPDDEEMHRRVLNRVCSQIPDFSLDLPAPRMAEIIYGTLREESGIADPYAEVKKRNMERALALLPRLEQIVDESDDRLAAAARVAIAGNVIDLGANPNFDLEAEIERLESEAVDLADLPSLREALSKADEVLYIGDNTAETVFDRTLIRELAPRRVHFAVRSEPIINDITEELAYEIGIDQEATVISSGSPIPGTDLNRVTDEFKHLFDNSPVVISKGQGNFETLSDCGRPIFFLFKVKCPVVAEVTSKPEGTSMLMLGGSN